MGEEFQRVAVFPVGVAQAQKIAALGGAGVVDENIEPAELAFNLRDQFFRSVLLAQIDDCDRGTAAVFADRSCSVVERGAIAADQHDIATFCGERERDAAPDAAARSGHERDFALQSEIHRRHPFLIVAEIKLRVTQSMDRHCEER